MECANCLNMVGLTFELVDNFTSGEHVTMLMWCTECGAESAMTLANTQAGCRVTYRAQ